MSSDNGGTTVLSMKSFSTIELFLHLVTGTCSFLDVPFFTVKVFTETKWLK